MKKLKQLLRFLIAIWNGEPSGHISDLWGEFTGRLVLCGKPPYQYLMSVVQAPRATCVQINK